MQFTESSLIPGLKTIQPPVFHDYRGEYIETFNEGRYSFTDRHGRPIRFVEDDVSISRNHVLRGLHGDEKTWKLIQCLLGEIYVVVVDMRSDSPAYLRWESFDLNEKNRMQLLIPAGCANGHLCLSERCIFSYKQSEYYGGTENQFTVRWDDPKLEIWWPIRNPILSRRDATAPFLP
ncbi:MAG TPA: dTDP-4-dehydrorhamnose 3,5-epimerase family protein [Acidobacteriota bacterium]|jgi:dTDP-4-dehydrorhamnose 3,5-epimerase|nr:dTDP-4-dehydrorhamnose 3,5-epimerase family protein [Acidobacteriota bacterium]HRR26812.1 dTDP-4-dehydrorhamnose 3,5-epimerase family protein [Acidobacteriota bacterium]HRV07353.1 dTDP-4-dehydrorhamnose 3,5-epimerase family protein [Acidobacteriota bacterium]